MVPVAPVACQPGRLDAKHSTSEARADGGHQFLKPGALDQAGARAATIESAAETQKPARRPLPDHLPREDTWHPAPCTCPSCGGALRRIGEDITETLDYVPGRFKVIRHIREKLSCRACDTVVAAPAPDHAIARGRAGAGLLAHIVVSKYDDHLPLYRQAEIFAREGVLLETSTLSGWVGATAAAMQPLIDALAGAVMASDTLHVDDTPVPVLAPGTGKTKTGRLWTYVRDERPFAGERPPAALFFYSPDRKGEHPSKHLQEFRGVIHADGYAGFNALFAGDRIAEAACWAHPWTAPSAQGKFSIFANHGRVQPSIRPGVAARRPQALMIFAAPFPITFADFTSDAPSGLDGAR